MSRADLITAHSSQTFGEGPSGFVLSVAAEGVSHIDDLVLGKGDLSNSGTVAVIAQPGGGVRITNNGSANGVASLSGPKVLDTAKKFAVEAKIKKSDITADGLFVGVAGGSLGSGVPIANNTGLHAIADNCIGFLIKDSDPDSVIPVSRDTSTTFEGAASAITASYVRLGFVYNPDDAIKIRFYVDGDLVAQSNASYPASGTALQFCITTKATALAANTNDVAFVAFATKR